MGNIHRELIFLLREKGIQRGFMIGKLPGANYYEKKKNGKWEKLKGRSAKEVFVLKKWKMPKIKENYK